MAIKSIVTFVQPHEALQHAPALEQALDLGAVLAARVVVLCFVVDVVGPEAASIEDVDLAPAKAAILALAERKGVVCEVVDRSSFAFGIGDVFADHLKVADLGVLRLRLGPYAGERLLVAEAVFDSGRPLLLAPQNGGIRLPSRVLVAWDGTAAAARAMHEALPLISIAGEAIVVRVSDDKALRMDQSGIEAAHHLARHGIRATFQEVQRGNREVFQALTDTARDTGSNLIVCGAVRHSATHDLLFGSVTKSILSNPAEVSVLLST
jgi:nucleotide-binding universal stress UspA family protein